MITLVWCAGIFLKNPPLKPIKSVLTSKKESKRNYHQAANMFLIIIAGGCIDNTCEGAADYIKIRETLLTEAGVYRCISE